MTTLPSFVELMSSLGLENKPQSSEISSHRSRSRSSSCSSSVSSPSQTPIISISRQPYKSQSIPSLRDLDLERRTGVPRRSTRYSPYSSGIAGRRGSLPSVSSNQSTQHLIRSSSTSPDPLLSSPTTGRRAGFNRDGIPLRSHNLSVSVSTPISTYVRRKTPHASPTSPTFTHHSRSNSIGVLSVPTLPTLLPQPSSSLLFSKVTAEAEALRSVRSSPMRAPCLLPEIKELEPISHRSNHLTGVHTSVASRPDLSEPHHSRYISPIA